VFKCRSRRNQPAAEAVPRCSNNAAPTCTADHTTVAQPNKSRGGRLSSLEHHSLTASLNTTSLSASNATPSNARSEKTICHTSACKCKRASHAAHPNSLITAACTATLKRPMQRSAKPWRAHGVTPNMDKPSTLEQHLPPSQEPCLQSEWALAQVALTRRSPGRPPAPQAASRAAPHESRAAAAALLPPARPRARSTTRPSARSRTGGCQTCSTPRTPRRPSRPGPAARRCAPTPPTRAARRRPGVSRGAVAHPPDRATPACEGGNPGRALRRSSASLDRRVCRLVPLEGDRTVHRMQPHSQPVVSC